MTDEQLLHARDELVLLCRLVSAATDEEVDREKAREMTLELEVRLHHLGRMFLKAVPNPPPRPQQQWPFPTRR